MSIESTEREVLMNIYIREKFEGKLVRTIETVTCQTFHELTQLVQNIKTHLTEEHYVDDSEAVALIQDGG